MQLALLDIREMTEYTNCVSKEDFQKNFGSLEGESPQGFLRTQKLKLN